jgi:hypothetical protein
METNLSFAGVLHPASQPILDGSFLGEVAENRMVSRAQADGFAGIGTGTRRLGILA